MPKTGRPTKPTSLKVLEGTARADRMKNEPRPPVRAPRCPAWLSPAAKSEWRRLVKKLEALGLISDLDRAALAAYAQSWARWQEAERALEEHGLTFETANGYVQQRPEVAIARAEKKAMLEAGALLGLSPSSRTRLDVKVLAASDHENLWEKFG